MTYTEIDHEVTERENGVSICRVTIQVDTAADIPEAEPHWAVGSMCIIADTHTYKRLNSEREWV